MQIESQPRTWGHAIMAALGIAVLFAMGIIVVFAVVAAIANIPPQELAKVLLESSQLDPEDQPVNP